MMLVTIGPEGGWEEPHELDMFKRLAFQRVSLRSRVLRSDGPVVSLLALAHGGLRVGFHTVVILAITAPGVPRQRRMVRARMPRKARQPLLPAAHAAAPILPHSIDNAATAAVYDRRSPLLHGRQRIGGDN